MKLLIKITFVLAFLAATLWFVKKRSPQLKIDGYSGVLLKLIVGGEDTKYAPKYSDSRFLKIKVGMTPKEVVTILGEPLVKWNPGESKIGYQYSESPFSTHYRLRQVYFLNGKVSDVIGYFYLD